MMRISHTMGTTIMVEMGTIMRLLLLQIWLICTNSIKDWPMQIKTTTMSNNQMLKTKEKSPTIAQLIKY
jgi:hypothetical protein